MRLQLLPEALTAYHRPWDAHLVDITLRFWSPHVKRSTYIAIFNDVLQHNIVLL